ncbi:hypothetical protein SFHH103_04026 (plasmid) [Sinorhizobium fredii HH103]|uniref:Uncharacterized protein n=1 Tax=Sinorhizobium fredii (strain HH103) TaxID=1117943 RepID=G9ABT8_SINF1|nr:hypothetical protein SFHH103_04026 [Sinorhizobium fredii HH103]
MTGLKAMTSVEEFSAEISTFWEEQDGNCEFGESLCC